MSKISSFPVFPVSPGALCPPSSSPVSLPSCRDSCAFYFILLYFISFFSSLSFHLPPSHAPFPVTGSWQMGLMHHKGDLKNSYPGIFFFYFFFFPSQLSFSLQSKGPVVWEEATKTNPSRKTEIVKKKCYSADNSRPGRAFLHLFQLPL